MGPSSEEASLRRRRPAFHAQHAGNIDAFGAEIVNQRISRGIVTDRTDRKDVRTEGCKIVRGVGAAARNQLRFAMAKNEHGSFARDAGNLAKLKFVGDKIAEENDLLRR